MKGSAARLFLVLIALVLASCSVPPVQTKIPRDYCGNPILDGVPRLPCPDVRGTAG
jgi:hypothetical protein